MKTYRLRIRDSESQHLLRIQEEQKREVGGAESTHLPQG